MKPNASHKPNHDPDEAEIAFMKRLIRDEKEAAHELLLARQIPAKVYTVYDLRPARVGE